jgi:hypothetical protein
MDDPKPQWLSNLVDAAQVLSALATAASVWVALWLARRSESQRLRFYLDERRIITIGVQPRTAQEALATHLKFTIVNAGVLPAHIQLVHFQLEYGRALAWGAVGDIDDGGRFPKTLNHGEHLSITLALTGNRLPTGSLLRWWWWLRRARFDVRTSLGRTTVRLKWKDIRWIRRAALFARTPAEDD